MKLPVKPIAVVAFVYQVTCMYLYLSMALWLVSISLNHFVLFDLLRSVNLSLLDHLKPVQRTKMKILVNWMKFEFDKNRQWVRCLAQWWYDRLMLIGNSKWDSFYSKLKSQSQKKRIFDKTFWHLLKLKFIHKNMKRNESELHLNNSMCKVYDRRRKQRTKERKNCGKINGKV